MSLCVDAKSQDLGGVVFLEPGVTIRCPANKKLWESLLCGGQELEEVIVFVEIVLFRNCSVAMSLLI